MMNNTYYKKTWKYSLGSITKDVYESEEYEDRMYNLKLVDEDDYRDIIVDIGNVDLYCKDIGLRTFVVKRWIDANRSINYKDLERLYNYMVDHTICFYHDRSRYSPSKLLSAERVTRSIEWFIREGLMSYEYISWGTHISENRLRQWIDEWDFRGLTYSRLKRICDFVLDRLDKNIIDEDREGEVLLLLP